MYICILYVSQEIGLDASIVRGHGYMSSSVGSLGVGSGSFTIQHIYISTYHQPITMSTLRLEP